MIIMPINYRSLEVFKITYIGLVGKSIYTAIQLNLRFGVISSNKIKVYVYTGVFT